MAYILVHDVCAAQTYDAIRVGTSHDDVGSDVSNDVIWNDQ